MAIYCSRCGTPHDDHASFCRKCGAAIRAAGAPGGTAPPGAYDYVPNAKSKIAAGLLGIFLGGLGIHRFYLGYVGIGIVQIIVTFITFGLGSLWGFIEGILLLTGTFDKDANGNLLRD
jgi:TM2 domain-containing membrane protein YozV